MNLVLKYSLLSVIYICIYGCNSTTEQIITNDLNSNYDAPSWAADAVWYQIFVERFRSGSKDNDPTRESLSGAWPDRIPESWETTSWTQDWYKPDPWFKDCDDPDNFYHGVQARRYGGDLLGVQEKLSYLKELGINAIYFNPINDAPSLHKYDASHYRHVDRHFGSDPTGDIQLMNSENPADPSTWKWTNADQLFLDIISECHKLGIRVVLDYSWNHTGRNFWAFKDVQEKGEQSDFKDWYYINSFDDPTTDSSEFNYRAWFGAMTLPELKEDLETAHAEDGSVHLIEGNIHSASLREHIFAVTQRWMDPNGDGDPSDGVDGYRLDVAAEIPMGFWREYRSFVKSINPEAILIGEIWWELWPDKLLDPKPFLGEAFDAVMNYRWYREARRFIAQAGEKTNLDEFKSRIERLNTSVDSTHRYAMMNLLGSHDSPRVLTSLYNTSCNYKMAKPHENAQYKIEKPDNTINKTLEAMLVHQYTFVGAPHIWNGDEMGMWGADDPDCRKPLLWRDMDFESERIHPVNGNNHNYEVSFNSEIYGLYRDAIKMRNEHAVLRTGSFEFVDLPEPYILAYSRRLDHKHAIILINLGDQTIDITLPITGNYGNVWRSTESIHSESFSVSLAPGQNQVWINH